MKKLMKRIIVVITVLAMLIGLFPHTGGAEDVFAADEYGLYPTAVYTGVNSELDASGEWKYREFVPDVGCEEESSLTNRGAIIVQSGIATKQTNAMRVDTYKHTGNYSWYRRSITYRGIGFEIPAGVIEQGQSFVSSAWLRSDMEGETEGTTADRVAVGAFANWQSAEKKLGNAVKINKEWKKVDLSFTVPTTYDEAKPFRYAVVNYDSGSILTDTSIVNKSYNEPNSDGNLRPVYSIYVDDWSVRTSIPENFALCYVKSISPSPSKAVIKNGQDMVFTFSLDIDPRTVRKENITVNGAADSHLVKAVTVATDKETRETTLAISFNELQEGGTYTIALPEITDAWGRSVKGKTSISVVGASSGYTIYEDLEASGNYIADMSAGTRSYVVSNIINNTGNEINVTAVIALYDENGSLVSVNTDGTDIAAGESAEKLTASIKVPDNAKNMRVKYFLWDMNTLKPLITNPADIVDFIVEVDAGREPVILQLTDTQIIDSSQARTENRLGSSAAAYWSPENMEARCFKYLKETVAATNPDLILLTGDLVYGEFDDNGTALQALIKVMDSFEIPWAPVFGNHDNESVLGVDWQCRQLENAKYCLFKQRTLTGNGNYTVGISQGGTLKRVFFMLDSNGCGNMSATSFANGHSIRYAGFGKDQKDWYTDVAQKINRLAPGMKYSFAFHIQPEIFRDALSQYGTINSDTVNNPINIDELPDKADTDFGYIGRDLKSTWDASFNVYNGLKTLGADSIFVGHEHCNSASVIYDGVRFQYGQKSSTYDRANYIDANGNIVGASSDKGFPIMGGTVMKMSETDGSFTDAYIYYCKTE